MISVIAKSPVNLGQVPSYASPRIIPVVQAAPSSMLVWMPHLLLMTSQLAILKRRSDTDTSAITYMVGSDLESFSLLTYRLLVAINFFFSSWYQGMYNAAIEAGDIVNKIIQAVDPPKKDFRIALTDVLSALSSGLVFLVIPEAAVISGAAAAIAPIFLKAIQQAPGIARIIWPEGSSQRESIEIAELYQNLGIVLQGLGPRIAGALAAVEGNDQSDVESFLAFAQDGYFSQPRDQWVNIANDTNGLLLGFTTFLASEALVLDGWHVEVALGVNPLQMSYTNATCPYWECDCGSFLDLGCSEFDNNSQCENNPWWYSNESNNSYTLSRDAYDGLYHPATHNEKDPTSIMQTIFNNGWSNGKLLLENAQTCVFDYSIQATYNTAELKTYLGEIFPSLNAVTFESDPCQHTNDSKGFWIKELQTGGLNLTRPNDTFYDADLSNSVPDPSPETRDWSCTTQLNLTVLEDWASVWYKHRHLT